MGVEQLSLLIGIAAILGLAFQLSVNVLRENPARRKFWSRYLMMGAVDEKYYAFLDFGLGGLSNFFQKPFSAHAFDRCVAIGGGYGFFFFMVAWAAGLSTQLTGVQLYPNQPTSNRIVGFVLFIVLILIGVYFWRRIKKIENEKKKWLVITSGVLAFIGAAMIFAFTLSQAPTGTAIVTGIAAGIGVFFVSGALAGEFGFSARTLFLLGAGAFVLAVILSSFNVSPLVPGALLGVFGFFVLLPLVNGVYDWLSWAISRGLAAEIRRSNHNLWRFITYIVIFDSLFAVLLVCLVPISWALGLFVSNTVLAHFGASIAYDYGALLGTAAAKPFTSPEGIWFTLMVATNLLPTALHVAIALAGFPIVLLPLRWRRQAAARLWKNDVTFALIMLSSAVTFGLGTVLIAGWGVIELVKFSGVDAISQMFEYACQLSAALGVPCVR